MVRALEKTDGDPSSVYFDGIFEIIEWKIQLNQKIRRKLNANGTFRYKTMI